MSESVGLANSRYLLFEEPSAASAMKGPQVAPSGPHDCAFTTAARLSTPTSRIILSVP